MAIKIINEEIDEDYIYMKHEFHFWLDDVLLEKYTYCNYKSYFKIKEIIAMIKYYRKKTDIQYIGRRDNEKIIILFDRAFKFRFENNIVFVCVYDATPNPGNCMSRLHFLKTDILYRDTIDEFNRIKRYITDICNEIIFFGTIQFDRKKYFQFKKTIKSVLFTYFKDLENYMNVKLKKFELRQDGSIKFRIKFKYIDDEVCDDITIIINNITNSDSNISIDIYYNNNRLSHNILLSRLYEMNHNSFNKELKHGTPNPNIITEKLNKIMYEIYLRITYDKYLDLSKFNEYCIGYYSDGILNYMNLYTFKQLDNHFIIGKGNNSYKFILNNLVMGEHNKKYTNKLPSNSKYYDIIRHKNSEDLIIFNKNNIKNY